MSHALLSLYLFVILRYGIINSGWWRDKEMHKVRSFYSKKTRQVTTFCSISKMLEISESL